MDFSAIIFNKAQVADIMVDIPHLVMQNKVFHPGLLLPKRLRSSARVCFRLSFSITMNYRTIFKDVITQDISNVLLNFFLSLPIRPY